MKTWILFGIIYALSVNLNAQDEYDCIDRNSYSIIKPSCNLKGELVKKASMLRTSVDVENQFGGKYKSKREYGEMSDRYYTQYNYSDGLTLSIPEDEKGKLKFKINSEPYALVLQDGTEIRVGMKADELQKIFPKSYARKKTIHDMRGLEGKILFIVYLSSTIGNQTIMEDAWINFILDPDTGMLEEFFYYEPL